MTVAELRPATARIRDAIRDAAAQGVTMRIVGSGTWLDAGRPVAADVVLSLHELSGVIEYVPGDLTITVGAGTSLGEIARVVGAEGQWLPLDPAGSEAGSIGATISTASAGPLAQQFGTPRDSILGLEFVSGEGNVVRGGGRVVKNVAGFDLPRLLTGAWGSLGAITEVTLRLRARPEGEATYAIAVLDSRPALKDLKRWLDALPFQPLTVELVGAALAERLGLDAGGSVLLLRLGGSEPSLRAQRALVSRLGDVRELPAEVWSTLRAAEPAGAAVVRLSQLPSQIPETWESAQRIAAAWKGTLVQATVGRGVVRCTLPRGGGSYDELQRALAMAIGTRVFERLPARLWPLLAGRPTADRLSRGIKHAFDPKRILNPGILGEETE